MSLGKITVIDDDPILLKAVERLLRLKGFDVESFASAEEFLAAGRNATCLVLDIDLGGMSGIELQRHLVAAGSGPRTIFITAVDNDATYKEATEAGCVAYLRKPFSVDALLGAIDQAAFNAPGNS